MLFSLNWLLQLCPAEPDLGRLVQALTARGLTVDAVDESGADVALDIDVAANRPDCLGHLGVARELAAATGVALAPRLAAPEPQGPPTASRIDVEIEDGRLCPRYTAGIIRGVRIGPSPAWVVARLERCGLRSVNNVVDVSNLVMLELGQPVHFFDLSRLAGPAEERGSIRVRLAQPRERLRTLDGVERRLDAETLVIADLRQAIAVAGVIGGADTEVHDSTRDVLVEAATFCPRSVRSTARRLGVQTDASFRFERGVDPRAPLAAQALAARLLEELAGGRPAPEPLDMLPAPPAPRQLVLRDAELGRLLGLRPEPAETLEALRALGFSPVATAEASYAVTVPSFRVDVTGEADLVEEVARHLGYDRIPTRVGRLPADPVAGSDRRADLEFAAAEILAHLGFHEALGYSMIATGEDERFVADGDPPSLRLANPIAEPLTAMRRSILPGLLRSTDLNLRRGNREVRLFEIGRVFLGGGTGALPDEPLRLGLAWSGAGLPSHWSRQAPEVDLYDLIGVVERLLSGVAPGADFARRPGAVAAFHPTRSVSWYATAGGALAWGGSLHPELQAGIDQPLFLAEVELGRLAALPRGSVAFSNVARFPAVTRDLSLVLPQELAYSEVLRTLRSVVAPAPVEFVALDRYEGPPLRSGELSLTIRLTLQPQERTLTDPQTEAYRESLLRELKQELGIGIRA